jgi:hypothetical protein
MDPLDFLEVARALSRSAKESERRTSIGRSYYAIFNHLCLRLYPIAKMPGTAEDHQAVVHYLMSANHVDLHSVGQSLKDLRDSRTVADYKMLETVGESQSEFALKKSDKAIQKFRAVNDGAFRAAIAAVPSFRPKRDSQTL